MLWYKAWRESRVPFLLIALFMAGLCIYPVSGQKVFRASVPISYTAYVYIVVFGKLGNGFLYFPPSLLGMGGLLRERGRGTAALSLSLPVSRLRQVGVRAALGLIEIAALALVPAILILTLSPIVGESYPISLALHFALLWIVCGSAIFAMAFLLSAVLPGEYTALLVSFIAIRLLESVTNMSSLQPFSLFRIEGGMKWPLPGLRMITGLPEPFPWATLFVIAIVAFALIAMATRITQREDF